MKNYVIINGTNSNTLTGLMINELPPITKPEMRTQVEEIDGRDGDIITKLGYSAYDKTITIGLFGTGYDVDNIIKFFNKEGTIVFSNEPDKYYNFTQVNGFDIERLLKFKTASITFHCQPFKYPTIETQKIIQPTILTSDGESITINNTGVDYLTMSLKGSTSQASTPTPTSPIPVSVVSGDNDIKITGKNLLNPIGASSATSGITFTNNGDGTYTANGTASAGVNFALTNLTTTPITLDANQQYTQTLEIISGTFGGSIVPAFKNSGGTITYNYFNCNGGSRTDSKTPTEKMTAHTYNLYLGSGVSITNCTFRVQLEKGTSTTYEPYTSQTYEVDLGTLELCKIGDYQDRIYKDNGNWYIEKNINKIVLDGTEAWEYGNVSGVFFLRTITNYATSNNIPYSNNYAGITNVGGASGIGTDKSVSFINQSGLTTPRFYIKDTTYTNNVNDLKTWLSTHNTIVYYVLATPTTTLIEDNNLIEQLDNLSNATSYEGTTNISQTNNDKPFIISASAVQSGTNEITINNIGNIYSKPLLALEGNGNVDIYLDNTQILKANVESKMNIDINTLEAYNPDTSALLNRQVIGNYNSMTFQPGNNKLTINGSLSKATITNYTRYL